MHFFNCSAHLYILFSYHNIENLINDGFFHQKVLSHLRICMSILFTKFRYLPICYTHIHYTLNYLPIRTKSVRPKITFKNTNSLFK